MIEADQLAVTGIGHSQNPAADGEELIEIGQSPAGPVRAVVAYDDGKGAGDGSGA